MVSPPASHVVPPGFSLRRSADHRRVPWANGGGTTREVAAVPDVDAWRWRLSIADVAADGPFSVLPGVQRTIAMLSGDGFVLVVGDQSPVRIDEPFQPFQFDGDDQTNCELIGGAVVDLNLMERGTERTLDLRFQVVTADEWFAVGAVAAVLVAAEAVDVSWGARAADSVALQPMDALVASSPEGACVSVRSRLPRSVVALVIVATG